MKTPHPIFILLFNISSSLAASADHDTFLACLKSKFDYSNVVYTPINSSYSSILNFTLWNLRFISDSTPKPQLIITPLQESQIPPIILCAKQNGIEIRTRSGGHDIEGVSSVSHLPFIIIDLIKLNRITVDVDAKTAWVEAGATIGDLYYAVAKRSSKLGFPAGTCPTVGVGGHFSAGGYGTLLRKYGLAADTVIDARIIDVNGRILDRKSMGEDLFWAIRGGGGASFGVITAWKVQLVDVPEIVTVFTVRRTLEQNATRLIHRWQSVAPELEPDLYIQLTVGRNNSTITASFASLFLGRVDRLLPLMQEKFPELGLVRADCIEMSWIESVLYFFDLPTDTVELLLDRTLPIKRYSKIKSDYVQKPVPISGFEGLWRVYMEAEGEVSEVVMIPYGGRMAEIPESSIPFPHRAGNLYLMAHILLWEEDKARNSDRYLSWARRVYGYMTPYVSKFPRGAYMNYRDLDIGVNNDRGKTSYEQASVWGKKYLKNNFDRLVRVKTVVDPGNFFRQEQTIPSLH